MNKIKQKILGKHQKKIIFSSYSCSENAQSLSKVYYYLIAYCMYISNICTVLYTVPEPNILLYSQTKGVKQKYIRCISGLVVYRQYIHHCSSQVDLHLAHGGESSLCSSAAAPG